jgi:hypothetical protein
MLDYARLIAQELRPVVRYAVGYRSFVRERVSGGAALTRVRDRLANRNKSFLRFVKRRIYSHSKSPYLPLLRAAGCEFGDLKGLVERNGLEHSLAALAAAGVRISIDEFKARVPITRGQLTLTVAERDFDNPYLAHHLEVRSGGTRSAGTRVLVDLDFIRILADDTALAFDAHRLWNTKLALWLPVGGTALIAVNIFAKLGCPPARWFTHVTPRILGPKMRLWHRFVVSWGRWMGGELPEPEYAPLADAARIALWMASEIRNGQRPCLMTYASSAVRICRTAQEDGLDLRGAHFITIGEPLTLAKRKAIEGAGAQILVRYAVTEAGILGYGCAEGSDSDDIHFLSDNLALIRHSRYVGPDRTPVQGLLVTSLLAESPKVLLNVETGDYAEVTERECGCPLGRAGLGTHLAGIRSFEKLTGEGMTFVGTRLISVLEEVLPQRFGGQPSDYQLVEVEDASGITRLELLINPAVGPVNEAAVVETFYSALNSGGGMRTMGEIWKQADILQVRRVTPIATRMGKILPFHLAKQRADSSI